MKWIAIKDQLPPVEIEVLLWEHVAIIGWRQQNAEFTDYHGDTVRPTHWAEITPPEIGETK